MSIDVYGEEFAHELADYMAHQPELRKGQVVFNLVAHYYPAITSEIAGTEVDCYYKDNKIDAFLDEVRTTLENA